MKSTSQSIVLTNLHEVVLYRGDFKYAHQAFEFMRISTTENEKLKKYLRTSASHMQAQENTLTTWSLSGGFNLQGEAVQNVGARIRIN